MIILGMLAAAVLSSPAGETAAATSCQAQRQDGGVPDTTARDNFIATVTGRLDDLRRLTQLGLARSHARDIRTVSERVLRDAQLFAGLLRSHAAGSRIDIDQLAAAGPSPPLQRLRSIVDPRAFNHAYVMALDESVRDLAALLEASEGLAGERALVQLMSTLARELGWDHRQVAGLVRLYGAPPPP